MSDEVERGNARVPVQYHQFDISDEDGPTGPDLERRHNGPVRVADGVTRNGHSLSSPRPP